MMTIVAIVLAIASLGVGFAVGWIFRQKLGHDKIARAEEHVRQIITEAKQEAEGLKQSKQLEIREELFQKRQELEAEANQRFQQAQKLESQLANREMNLDRKVDLLNKKKQELSQFEESLRVRDKTLQLQQQELERLTREQNVRLEQISGLTTEEARRLQLNNVFEQAKQEAAQTVKEIKDRARMEANREAKEIIVQAIQRTAISHVVESTVSIVKARSASYSSHARRAAVGSA